MIRHLSTIIVWSRLQPEVRRVAEKLARAKGISLSEHIRQLIISDLDKRSIFTSRLKYDESRYVAKKDIGSSSLEIGDEL